jgi:hypothetical protein
MEDNLEVQVDDSNDDIQIVTEKPRDPSTGRFVTSRTGEAETEVKVEVPVEVVDDTPPEDRGRPKRTAEPKIPSDDEIAKYGDDVQKRIKSLKYEFHTERRRADESERIREEAVRVAQKLWQENESLKQRYSQGEGVLKDQAGKRVTAELKQARQEYRAAFESGDLDALAAAQEKMAELAAEKVRVESYVPVEPPRMPQPQEYIPPPTPRPDPKALDWAAQHPWFGQDDRMTRVAVNIEERMIREEGYDPRTEEHYQELEARVKKALPQAFPSEVRQERQPEGRQVQVQEKPRTIVAPATRAPASKSPRKVTLTASQVNLANRLGLTVQQYAEQLLEEQKND